MLNYISRLTAGKIALWCYLLWYLITVIHYFDPTPTIWLNSVGISLVIGVALMLSVNGSSVRGDPWQAFRLFMMPFCVSSFAALIKERGFVLIFPPTMMENLISIGTCAVFVCVVVAIKRANSDGTIERI
jgi:hypothetical protein